MPIIMIIKGVLSILGVSAIVLLAFNQTAFAEDLRGIPYGVGCDYVDLQEHNAESIPYDVGVRYQYLIRDFTYSGVTFKGVSRIQYFCNSSNLFVGAQIFLANRDPSNQTSLLDIKNSIDEVRGQSIQKRDVGLMGARYIGYAERAHIWPLSKTCGTNESYCHYIALGKTRIGTHALMMRTKLLEYKHTGSPKIKVRRQSVSGEQFIDVPSVVVEDLRKSGTVFLADDGHYEFKVTGTKKPS